MKNLYFYFQLIRPANFLITFITVFVAVIICSYESINIALTIAAAFSASLTAASGNIINDYFDSESDKINHPNRPISSGKISKKNAVIFYMTAAAVSVLISLVLPQTAFYVVLLAHFLLLLYSYSLKKKLFIGNFVVAFLTGFVFIFGGIVAGNVKLALIPALFAFLINLIREFIKDMEDTKGDSAFGAVSIAGKYGMKTAKHFALFFSTVLILSTLYPFLTSIYNIEFFLIVMSVVNPITVYVIKSLYENDSSRNLNKLSNILKLNMVFGLIAIYLGR